MAIVEFHAFNSLGHMIPISGPCASVKFLKSPLIGEDSITISGRKERVSL